MSFGIKATNASDGALQAQVEKNLRKLANGERINSAGDDAASFAIAVSMEAKERSYNVAGRNAQDASARLQVGDGALAGQQENLARLRELAVASANGSLSPADRQAIQTEANGVVSEIDRIGKESSFNGKALLANNSTDEYQVGTSGDAKDRIKVTSTASTAQSLGVAGIDLSSPAAASAALDTIDVAVGKVSQSRVNIGAAQNRFSSALASSQVARESAANARAQLQDTDVAAATSELASSQIRARAQISMQAQFNAQKGSVLKLLG